MSLSKLNAPSLSAPRVSAPSVYVPRLQAPTLSRNYYITNQENRHVRDLGDIILGNPITGTKQLRKTLVDNGAVHLVYVPILNRIAGTLFMVNERTLMPLAKGDIGTVFINGLETIGNTLDIVANPIKSLMPWAGGGSTTDLYKSMGWLDDAYREAYQWNTGNWLVDVVGEFASDPINWITFGAAGLAKKGSQSLDDIVTSLVIKNTDNLLIGASDDVLMDKKFIHNLSERIAATAADADSKLVKDLFDRAVSNRRQLEDMLSRPGLKAAERRAIKARLNHFDELINNDLYGKLTDLCYEVRMSDAYRYYNAVRRTQKITKEFDNALTNTAFALSPAFGAGKQTLKFIGSKTYKVLHNAWVARLTRIDKNNLFPNQAKTLFKDTLDDLSRRSYLLHQNTYKKLDQIFSKYGFDPKRLQLMYLEIYNGLHDAARTTQEATKIFRERLFRYMPELEAIYKTQPNTRVGINKMLKDKTGINNIKIGEVAPAAEEYLRKNVGDLVTDITVADINDFTDSLEELTLNVDEAGVALNEMILKQVEQDFELFLKKENMYDSAITRLEFAIKNYMVVDGVQYGLHNLEEFIAALQEGDSLNYARVMTILDYLGITVDTAPKLNTYFKHSLDYFKVMRKLGDVSEGISNLHRVLKRQVDDLLNADFNTHLIAGNTPMLEGAQGITRNELEDAVQRLVKLQNGFVNMYEFSEGSTLSYEDINAVIKLVKDTVVKIKNMPYPNTLGDIAELNNIINTIQAQLITLRKLNKVPGRFNYEKQIIDLLTNNKQGGLAAKYTGTEIDHILKTFSYKSPRINTSDLAALRKRALGHEAEIAEIEQLYSSARNYQVEFVQSVTKVLNDYKDYLDTITTPLDTKMSTDELMHYADNLKQRIDMIPEPDKNLSYKDWLEARSEKTMLENELAAITSGVDTRQGIIDELDMLDHYAGLSDDAAYNSYKTPRGVIKDLLAFEMSNDYNLESFDELYADLKNKVKHWRAAEGYNSLSLKARQFVDDLNGLFIDTKEQPYTAALVELMADYHQLYYMMLRKTNNFNMVFNAIHIRVGKDGTWSDADKAWFDRLMDPTRNDVRNNLKTIAGIARDNDLGYLATDIYHILASLEQLQAYATIEKTLREKYAHRMSKEQCNYIINLVYNYIINSRLDGSSCYTKADLNRFLYEYFNQYRMQQYVFVEQDVLEHAAKNGITFNPNTVLTDETLDYMPEAEFLEQFNLELTQDISDVYETYLATLNNIARNTDINITVRPMINYDHMMDRIKELAADYKELMDVISNPQLQAEFKTFVSNIGGKQVAYEEALRLLPDEALPLAASKRLTADELANFGINIDKLAPNMNRDGIFDALHEGFKQIGTINADLAGKTKFVNVIRAGEHRMEKVGLVTQFLTYQELNDFITRTGVASNIYDYTLANDYGLAFKKYTTPKVFLDLDQYKNAKDLTGEFRGFMENYRRALAFIRTSKEEAVLDYRYLDNARQALIEVYSNSDASYAPVNSLEYFTKLDYEDIRAWDMVTRVKPLNQSITARYTQLMYGRTNMTNTLDKLKPRHRTTFTFGDRISYNEDPNALFRSLEKNLQHNGFVEPEAYKGEIDIAAYRQFANIREYAATNMKQWVKDPETLLHNSFNYNMHIKNDVDAWENVRILDAIAMDKRTIGSTKMTTQQRQVLQSYGILSKTRKDSPTLLKYYTQERANVLTESLKTWSANDIRSYLDHDTQGLGFIVYVSDISEYQFNNGMPFDHFTKQELREAGIEIHTPFKDKPYIQIIRKSKNQGALKPLTHKFFRPRYIFKEEQNKITGLLKRNRHYFEYDGGRIHPEFFTGEVMDLDTFDAIMDSDEMVKILGDDVERKSYSKAFAKGINNNFIINSFIVGGPNATNEFLSCFAERFKDLNKDIPYRSTELPRILYSGNHTVITRANNAVKYLELFFNEDYALGSKHFVNAFKDVSDKEIADFFKKGNYVAMAVKEDKQHKPRILKIVIENRADLDFAIAQGAVAVPYEVYRNAVLTINKNQLNSKLLNIYRRTVVGTFKTIYLTSAGFLMRNEMDSAIYKNAASTEGVTGMYEMIKYQKRAWDLWKRYSNIQKTIIDSTKADADSLGTLNKRATRKCLENLSKQDVALYQMIDIFAMSSASGGYSKALQDMLASYNFGGPTDLTPWERAYNEKLLNNRLSPARWVMDLNSQIEQTSRLALFLKVVDESGDYAKAIKEVVTTHFDYELREPGFQLFEDIFWFSTFPINNMYYYLNEGLTRNPDLFKLYMDMLEQSWNSNDITWDDVRKNNYYAYNAMRGNLRFKIAGKDIVLKTSNSVMDYLNILASPFEEAKERLNPFLAVLLGIEPVTEINPLVSTVNRFNQLGVGPGKSLIPSVYMELYPQFRYKKVAQYYNNYTKRTWVKYPRRINGPDNISYIKYKYITNAYSLRKMNRSRLWLTSTTSITPHWYHDNYKLYKTNSRLNRAQRKLKLPVYKT